MVSSKEDPTTTENAAGSAEQAPRPELVAALSGLDYEESTPSRRAAIQEVLAGRDLVGQAAAGTDKTATLALPVLQRLRLPRREPAGSSHLLAAWRPVSSQHQ